MVQKVKKIGPRQGCARLSLRKARGMTNDHHSGDRVISGSQTSESRGQNNSAVASPNPEAT
jgi:hypothetical protein